MSRRGRQPRGVVDTSVVVAGIGGFKPRRSVGNSSASFLREWLENDTFTWLLTEEILSEYKQVLTRLGVRRNLVGQIINLLREEGEFVDVRGESDILCVDFSRSWVADAAERGTFNSRLAAQSTFSAELTRISQTRAEWLFFGVDSDFALVLVAANRAAFQSSRRSSRESSDDAGISATVSMPLVATCSDGEGRPGSEELSEQHPDHYVLRERV